MKMEGCLYDNMTMFRIYLQSTDIYICSIRQYNEKSKSHVR